MLAVAPRDSYLASAPEPAVLAVDRSVVKSDILAATRAEPIAIIRSLPHPSEAKEPRVVGEPGAGGVFVVLLQSVVYLTGAVFLCSGVFYVVAQRKAGKDVWAAVPTLDPEDFEQGSKNPMASNLKITPDVAYTGGK